MLVPAEASLVGEARVLVLSLQTVGQLSYVRWRLSPRLWLYVVMKHLKLSQLVPGAVGCVRTLWSDRRTEPTGLW
jgi:hypothetical protein